MAQAVLLVQILLEMQKGAASSEHTVLPGTAPYFYWDVNYKAFQSLQATLLNLFIA